MTFDEYLHLDPDVRVETSEKAAAKIRLNYIYGTGYALDVAMLGDAVEAFKQRADAAGASFTVMSEECGRFQEKLRLYNKYRTTNPVEIAYRILRNCYLEHQVEPMHAIEEALGYLGEALDE